MDARSLLYIIVSREGHLLSVSDGFSFSIDWEYTGEELEHLSTLDLPLCVFKTLGNRNCYFLQKVSRVSLAQQTSGYCIQYQDVTDLVSQMNLSLVGNVDNAIKDIGESVDKSLVNDINVAVSMNHDPGGPVQTLSLSGLSPGALPIDRDNLTHPSLSKRLFSENLSKGATEINNVQKAREANSVHGAKEARKANTPNTSIEAMEMIYKSTHSITGEQYLEQLARLLTHLLHVRLAFVGYCIPSQLVPSSAIDLMSALTPPGDFQSVMTGLSKQEQRGEDKRFRLITLVNNNGQETLAPKNVVSAELASLLQAHDTFTLDSSRQWIISDLFDSLGPDHDKDMYLIVASLRNAEGAPSGCVGVMLPAALDPSQKDLVQAVLESVRPRAAREVAQLEELEQLKKDKMAAELATKSKSNFLANMSHEIRTPVSAIIGLTDMILWDSRALSDENKSRLDLINSSGEHLLAVINGVLDLSKIGDQDVKFCFQKNPLKLRKCIKEAVHLAALSPAAAKKKILILDGQKTDNPVTVDAGALLPEGAKMADLVRVGTRENSLPFYFKVDSNVPEWILGDVTRIRQIVLNLLTNALKFTDQGSITFTVTRLDASDTAELPVPLFEGQHHPLKNGTASVSGGVEISPVRTTDNAGSTDTSVTRADDVPTAGLGKAVILFTVVDTGCGIPREKINRLFMPYSQIDNPNNRDSAVGTGLGLAISSRLVQMMGGQIWVESSESVGSKFSFCVPFPIVEPAETSGGSTSSSSLSDTDQDATTTSSSSESPRTKSPGRRAGASRRAPSRESRHAQRNANRSAQGDTHSDGNTTQRGTQHHRSSNRRAGRTPRGTNTTRKSAKYTSSIAEMYPLSILVAEDNPINQQIALSLLQKMGYDADLAIDGVDVLEKVDNGKQYDLILMDLSMPRMGGLETMNQLVKRSHSGYSLPIVIALTASGTEDDYEACQQAGMHDWLNKPFKALDLETKISTHFSHLLHSSAKAAEPTHQQHHCTTKNLKN
ncbi:uncharacterized protein SPPG_01619 [Spizellomyces punctatus DAOM BR117]|uniref:histidine kinase n=1 Tax=Spizellomyces punctatus (strain DAOM BR117) TaxID=645134 RepID=A0A0L0HTG4_SPIPD|nr:uncharacterized protein SPPG_01619 [Spizellomyces punctatus DAOM BR117]KND04185.1 hypothetical protein SPPG_01619 [Spizellomyces punctatus DAOM BR117]|eukprot:XP_016612224.1 hypothetical protein SPPG_01619 [Spizellomyces punctatus DAOM BR117]